MRVFSPENIRTNIKFGNLGLLDILDNAWFLCYVVFPPSSIIVKLIFITGIFKVHIKVV